MRVRQATWAILGACAVAAACGESNSSGPEKGRGGGGTDAGGGGGRTSGGGARAGTSSDRGGADGGAGGAEHPAGGSDHDAGGAASGAAGATDEPGAGGAKGAKTIRFEVDAGAEVHPISPLIYGANVDGLDCGDAKARFTFCRSRSAAWSTYNWENNASNAGSSDCNENGSALSSSDEPGRAVTDLIDEAEVAGAATLVTLPMLDRVAADKDGGSAAPECSGDVSKTNDYLNQRFRKNRPRKGSAFALEPDTSDAFVNQDEFVAKLKRDYSASRLLFALDSQPELWNVEHPKLRAAKLSYAEQVALSVDHASAVKDAWPTAEVLGLVGYGYLAALSQQASPDYALRGEFYGYFLKELAQASQMAGHRLLDYVDLHWFPELYVDGRRIIEETSDAASALARVQAPRTLWDPNFVEDSWITQGNGQRPIELLTWLKAAIDSNYPGTKLAISEWSYGGGKHISGAIAAADALGIYGQKGVDLAGVVSFSPDTEPYLIGAFQAYRNYDGQGLGFGDTSIAASSSDVQRGTIYASVDAADASRMVIVAINRFGYDLDATLNIKSATTYASLTPYSIRDGQPEPVLGDTILASASNRFEMTLPPYSVWVLVPQE